MRHLTLTLFALALMAALTLAPAHAQEPAPLPAVADTTAPATPEGAPAAPDRVSPVAPAPSEVALSAALPVADGPPPTTEELIAAGKAVVEDAVEAAEAQKDTEGVQWMAIFGALASAFSFLLLLARRVGGMLLNEQWLRIATLALGGLAALFAGLATGAPDWAVILLGLSGPASMIVYAVVDLFRPGTWAKAKVKAEAKKAISEMVGG